MRLLILSTEFPPGPGGIGTHAWQLAEGLRRRGWQVRVLTPQDYATDTAINDFNQEQKFLITTLPSKRGSVIEARHRWQQIKQAILQDSPNILLASGGRMAWLGALAARQYRVPFVAVGHGTEFGLKTGWQTRIIRLAWRQADSIVCVSNFTRRLMLELGIKPKSEIVIPNGADDTQFCPLPPADIVCLRHRLAETFGLGTDMQALRLILTVGQVSERKGQEVVIRAMPQILSKVPSAHYLMVGLETLKEKLTSLARQLGVSDHVHFAGQVSARALVEYLNAADLFAMTSQITDDGDCEGFGIAVVEAAMCGKPAVISDGSGLREAIIPNQTGLVAAPGDEHSTAAVITRLLQDDELRARMGQAARQYAQQEQTWQHRISAYDELLRQLAFQQASLANINNDGKAVSTGS
jgi:phosphatidylinositol alpha-1,6-mannosyltransferase